MKFSHLAISLAISILLDFSLPAAQSRNEAQAPAQENSATQPAQLKAIDQPMAPYPLEAVRRGIEGKVTMSIVVDANGKTVEIGYGVPKECPGPKSDMGGVEGNGRLMDKNGKLIAVVDNDAYPLPSYPIEERMAGVAGKMVLSVTLKRDGYVKELHVVKSLSPGLDKAAIDLVRGWKFKGCQDERQCGDRDSSAPWKDLRLQFVFRALCPPRFSQN